jgi:hypothetical protein
MKCDIFFLFTGLMFAKQGHLPNSPYCVILQAREQLRKKIHVESSTVCITSDMTKVHEMLPKPERRQQDKSSVRKSTTPITPITLSTPSALSIKRPQFYVEYPSEITLFSNATFLARVAEPTENLTDSKIK